MSFGTVSSTPTGGGSTLTGFILSKASQSRKEAKKKDRTAERKEKKKDQSTTETKSKEQKSNPASKLLGSLPKIGDLFSFKKPQIKSEEPKTRTSGGATGLAQILTQGFGSLSADTMGISSGLASVTQVMNSSLKAQSFTATGIQTIASILSDQLENQGSILSTVKSLRPGGGGGGGGKSLFGTSKSRGTSSDTLTEALINAAIEKGIGRFITSRLSRLNPFKKSPITQGAGGKPTRPRIPGTGPRVTTSGGAPAPAAKQPWWKKMLPFADDAAKGGTKAGAKGVLGKGVEAGKGLLGKAKGFGDDALRMGGSLLDNPITKRLAIAGTKFGGRALPFAGSGFSAAEAADRAKKGDAVGAWLAGLGAGSGTVATGAAIASAGPQAVATGPTALIAEGTSLVADLGLLGYDIFRAFKPMAQGGVMVGESAGSQGEEVMSLTSAAGRKITGDKGSTSDPGMQASAASTLSVVDQFIKGMGPLGAPVAQALGPDIANLTRTFGMSQTLPNLKLGGGKFKEDGNAKRTRDNFLQKLISGSLEALGAKKKGDATAPPTGTAPPSNPGDTGTAAQQKAQQQAAASMVSSVNNMQIPGKPQGTMGTTGVSLPGGSVAPSTPDKLRPVENGNNKFWYDKDGQIYHWQAAKDKAGKPVASELKALNRTEMGEGADVSGNLMANQPQSTSKRRFFIRDPYTGKVKLYQPSWMETSGVGDILQWIGGKGKDEYDNNIPQGYYSYKWDDVYMGKGGDNKAKWKRASGAGDIPPFGGTAQKFQKGGKVKPWWDFLNLTQQKKPKERALGSKAKLKGKDVYWAGKDYGWQQQKDSGSATMNALNKPSVQKKFIQDKPKPKPKPARAPVAATQQASSDMDSTTVINVVSAGGGGSAPIASNTQTQASSNYISNPWPNGLAGVICTSPWSVV